jgi:uncharacterized membrane protein YhaH (DUF805 family)
MNNFGIAIKHYWINYANFKGVTSKPTYWWAVLFVVVADLLVQTIFPGHQETSMWMDMEFTRDVNSGAYNLWSLATLVPSLSLLVRRLHDTGRSGANAWFLLLPIIGWILLLIWTLEGTKSNQYSGEAAN